MNPAILVVGSVAFDSVRTPFGGADEILGGSATYFSVAASYFARVRVVAVVGHDFNDTHDTVFRKHDIDTDGLVRAPGRTFRWTGEYGVDFNEARTLETQLNVFENFEPVIPPSYRSSEYVFLGNIDPELQVRVLEQIEGPRLVACDTMNFWIQESRMRSCGPSGMWTSCSSMIPRPECWRESPTLFERPIGSWRWDRRF